jgi:hypothetical protein
VRYWEAGMGQVTKGFSSSTTVTLKEQVAVPQEFVAVQVTVVVPTGKGLPEGGLQLTAGVGVPVALTDQVTTAPHLPDSLDTVISPGHVIEGGVQLMLNPKQVKSRYLSCAPIVAHPLLLAGSPMAPPVWFQFPELHPA